MPDISDSALSTDNGSPGLNFLYNSNKPFCWSVKLSSLWSVETSLAIVAISFGSSPNVSIISAFVPIPKARINTVIGTFLFLSTLT